VDHPISLPAAGSELVRPWRTATLVATAVAGLELVLLIVFGLILLGRTLAPHVQSAAVAHAAVSPQAGPVTSVAPTPRPRVQKPVAVKLLPRTRTGVLVLNGNGVTGAAAQAAVLVKARGYLIKDVGDAPHTGYPAWRVMYRPGFEAEARRFATDMSISQVGPLDGMTPAQLHGAQLGLILGASR
jgi:hypothetical protein